MGSAVAIARPATQSLSPSPLDSMAQRQPRAKTPRTTLAAETPSSTTSTAASSTTATLDRSGKKKRGTTSAGKSYGEHNLSGSNAHGWWRVCEHCRLRLAYAPAWGAHGHYRQAAPLGADVKKVVMKVEEKEERGEPVDRDILTAKNVALDGADQSLLTKVRSQMVLSNG